MGGVASRPSATDGAAMGMAARAFPTADRATAPARTSSATSTLPTTSSSWHRAAGHTRVLRELGDPVVALIDALGWNGTARRSGHEPASPGRADGLGRAASSPQVADDALRISWTEAVDARGTPVGKYIGRVESIVAEQWRSADLSTHARGAGQHGQVTIRYTISSTGKVTAVRVVRASGVPELDAMAAAAIPARLPRFPRDLDRASIVHEIVLRYRNPAVGP
ncbi:MAG: TonB family protein [Myxococcota bacterium]|jgi:TonB family protein